MAFFAAVSVADGVIASTKLFMKAGSLKLSLIIVLTALNCMTDVCNSACASASFASLVLRVLVDAADTGVFFEPERFALVAAAGGERPSHASTPDEAPRTSVPFTGLARVCPLPAMMQQCGPYEGRTHVGL